jgi:HPt (histidine-containing phosphotransfer) domain-containing protein
MTAHAMAGDEKKSRDAGMNDHITKPIDPEQLFGTLQKWIPPREKRKSEPARLDKHTLGDPESMDMESLPESLPEFDLQAGLERLRGNERLYRKLLVDFGTKYAAMTADIKSALKAKDMAHAHGLIHNLKGMAGNLEAAALQAAAAEMETLVKGKPGGTEPDSDVWQKFDNLEEALNRALDAVKPLVPAPEEKPATDDAHPAPSLPPEPTIKAAAQIKAAAEMGDVSQIVSIAKSLTSESEVFQPVSNKLVQLAEDFDFDGIVRFAEDLEKSVE